MKILSRIILSFIALIIFVALFALVIGTINEKDKLETNHAESEEEIVSSYSSDTNEVSNKMQLKKNAYAVLDTLSDDERVSDYITAVDILENLPKTKDSFLNELKKVQKITDKYNIELHYMDYFLSPSNSLDNSNDDLYEYISSTSKARKDDLEKLTEGLIYPAIFEAYGENAQHIKNIDIDKVHKCFSDNGYTELSSYNETVYGITEEWAKPYSDGNDLMEVRYYTNGLVENVTIPLIFSDEQLDSTELMSLFDLSPDDQKSFEEKRFEKMAQDFTDYTYGKDILYNIFSEDDLTMMKNYISSLNEKNIWENDILGTENRSVWLNATLPSRISDKDIALRFSTNKINLYISGINIYNEFTYKYYTVYCGMLSKYDDVYSLYSSFLDEDETRNNETPALYIDMSSAK